MSETTDVVGLEGVEGVSSIGVKMETRDVVVGEVDEVDEVDEDIIEVGRAQGRAVKGEDTLYVRGSFDGPADQRTLCAAVFDGHGGKAASAAALKTVGDRLMDHGPPFDDALIANSMCYK
jgi:hypothetical protein